MESLAAVGLANNVIQFVDFGIKLLVGAKDLYQSSSGLLEENAELDDVTRSLQRLVAPLSESSNDVGQTEDLRHIAALCVGVGKDLVELLERLRLPADARSRTWESLRLTIMGKRKGGKLKKLEGRLTRLQAQLNTHLLTMVPKSTSQIGSKIDGLVKTNERLQAETTRSLQTMKDDIISTVRSEISKSEPGTVGPNQSGESVEQQSSSTEQGGDTQSTETYPAWRDIFRQLNLLSEEANYVAQQQRVLRSLYYHMSMERFHDVPEAYRTTFRWLFDDPNLGFRKWLESSENIPFWITGKPGSGKSTLMKYICESNTTAELLGAWAGDRQLNVAKHFFWLASNKLQRSLEGLFRSLMYQILRKSPNQIENTCPERWNSDEFTMDEPWTLRNLSDCLDRLANCVDLDGKAYFVVVDGLDEYEGDHREVIRILNRLNASDNFKVCVSSRPWNVFESEYGVSRRKLFMEELTGNDIRLYIEENLQRHEYLRQILDQDTRSKGIVEKVSEKAEGVFLWVYYVVRLLTGSTDDAPTLSDLHRIVDEYPDDLDPLFERILFSTVPKHYWQGTAQILQACLRAINPPSLTAVKFLEMERENTEYALQSQVRPLTDDEAGDIRVLKKRLKGRCMDLVEMMLIRGALPFGMNAMAGVPIPQTLKYRVEFFHLTVKDFLKTKKKWLDENAGPNFDPLRALTNAILAVWKGLPSECKIDFFSASFRDTLTEFMYYAYMYEEQYGEAMTATLEELDKVLSIHSTSGSGISGTVHWSYWLELHTRFRRNDLRGYKFLSLAIQFGLRRYVGEKLDQDNSLVLETKDWPLLDYALRPALHPFNAAKQPEAYKGVDLEMVRILLRHGSDPNQVVQLKEYGRQSVWCHFLSSCCSKAMNPRGSGSLRKWKPIVQVLLEHGAEIDAKFRFMHGERNGVVGTLTTLKVREVLEKVFPEDAAMFSKRSLAETTQQSESSRMRDIPRKFLQGKLFGSSKQRI